MRGVVFLFFILALFGQVRVASARIIDDFSVGQPMLSANLVSPVASPGTATGTAADLTGNSIIGGTRQVSLVSTGATATASLNGSDMAYAEGGTDAMVTFTYDPSIAVNLMDGGSDSIVINMIATDPNPLSFRITLTSGGGTSTFSGVVGSLAVGSNRFPFSGFTSNSGFSFATVDLIVFEFDLGAEAVGNDFTIDLIESAGPPSVAKSFTPSSIGINGTSTLTITLTNANMTNVTGVAFTDPYPSGVVTVGGTETTNCLSGTVLTTSGSVMLTGGAIAASSSCTVTVTVTSAAADSYVNTILANGVTTNFGSNTAPASATLTVVTPTADVSVVKTITSSNPVAPGGGVTYQVVVSNAGPSSADGAVFSDTVPAELLGVTFACGGATGGAVCGPGANPSTIPTLPNAGSVTYTITATAPLTGTISTNTATITPPVGVTDPTPGNNSSTTTTITVTPTADVSVVKTITSSNP
ncbi:MAG: DUF11 domain-containing protein, partial [Nitrospirota bacterium]